MKIEGYEEISEKEYKKLPTKKRGGMLQDDKGKVHFFQQKQKLPKVLESDDRKIEFHSYGLVLVNKNDGEFVVFDKGVNFLMLIKAVKIFQDLNEKSEVVEIIDALNGKNK